MSSAVSSVGSFFGGAITKVLDNLSLVKHTDTPLAPDPAPVAAAVPDAPAPEPQKATAPATGAAATDLLGQSASAEASKPAPPPNSPQVREQPVSQRAAAAGAVRSDNQADQLGFVAPKKRSASRSILG